MNRIDAKFRELSIKRKKAFIAFLTAGYPDFATTEKLVLEFEKQGVDLVELGVPFSDPIADGPVIQMSSFEALKKGATLRKVLDLVARLRKSSLIPLAAMSYFNPILQYGLSRFIADALKVGLDAVIIPDLPPEEEREFTKEAQARGLYVIRFIAPTTSLKRAKFLVKQSKGFIYFVSLTGVTGTRQSLPSGLRRQLRKVKSIAGPIPVCAGFGVTTPEHVRLVSSACDGCIVGSAIVREITKNLKHPRAVFRVGAFVRKLKGA